MKKASIITLAYVVFGFSWIIFSDIILKNLIQNINTSAQVEVFKSGLLVFITSVMIFFLVKNLIFHQQQIVQRLRNSEQQFKETSRDLQIIIDNIPSRIIYKDTKNNILRVNKVTAEALGLTAEDMAGKPTELFYPDQADEYYKDDLDVIRSGQSKLGVIEKTNIPDNPDRWIESNKIPIRIQEGKVTEILIIATDITERKEADEKILQQQTLLEAIFNDIPDALMLVDLDRKFLMLNPGVSRVFSYDKNELIGKSTEMLYQDNADFQHQGGQRFNHQADALLTPYVVNYRRKNGEIFPGESIGAIIKDINEKPIGYLGLIRDVSDRVAMEQETSALRERLAHVNRLSTMSEMTAGIAHEINQPLAAISNYAQASRNLFKNDPTSPKLADALQKISEQAIRAGDIIRKLRDFIKQRESKYEQVDCNEMIRKVVQLTDVDTGVNNIPIILKLNNNLPVLSVDPVQIQQVILNLVRNATDALLSTNTLKPEITIYSSFDKNRGILVAVEDNGPGINSTTAENIFTPFVSTKKTGMGMGLSISRTLVKSHGGDLNYKPRSSGGSRFYFTLPVVVGE